ncbi:electron transfer flavoprotein subunit alpha/FixB family protein [Agaribacterium haliotis]|uniref:electron transfer flavoprotein subunit alpha/FixB family protein n=1 Tax=Agaribacterium haliotis TaxID=2013869 RepID=UPI000BB5590D|nr:FAD-binding protein [Agaribacterium haliotis]
MAVLIIAEHKNDKLNANIANVVQAASQLSDEIDVLVAGKQCQALAQQAALWASRAVLLADADHYEHQLAEELAPLLQSLAADYSHILCAAGTFGKNLLPRAAALADAPCLSDVCQIESAQIFVRPIYAGNALAKVRCAEACIFITLRSSSFDAAQAQDSTAPIRSIEASPAQNLSSFIGQELAESERPELAAARVVVSGGRGMGSAENFALSYELADQLNGAVGASRAAVDAGFAANDMQVGQTGKIVAPELYIAVGISGAIQHLAGMKDSKVIVAINKDEDAPIFQVADYGLVADLFDAVPELIEALKK